ncbi:phosphopantetheine-binding protein [Actinokineospora sp. NPDC004072]
MSRLAEIKGLVAGFVVAEFAPDVRPGDIADDFDLLDSGVVDSLGLLRLIAWVGERFAIPVAELPLTPDQFRSVAAVAAFVESAAVVGERAG